MPSVTSTLTHISRRDLYTSLPSRIQYLHSFLEFGPDDVQALISGQKYVKQVIPAIVNIVYKKLLKYDITARVFKTRDSRDEGEVGDGEWVKEDSQLIQHRKMFLRWYLTKLNSDCTKMEYWEYLDKVGLMHVGKGRRNPLHVDYIFLGVCLAYIQDTMFEAILSHPKLELSKKIAIVKALGKVIWIQNDLIERWHNSDGAEYQTDEDIIDEVAEEEEGYIHGKKLLGDDAASAKSENSTNSSDSSKTSLGRPVEEATHLEEEEEGISRCPFSGMATGRQGTGRMERQRAESVRESGRSTPEDEALQKEFHRLGIPQAKIVDGKVVLTGKLEQDFIADDQQ